MPTGTVKWFNADKGYGFITPDVAGPDLFVHHSAIEASGFRQLTEGQKVEYTAEQARRGLRRPGSVLPSTAATAGNGQDGRGDLEGSSPLSGQTEAPRPANRKDVDDEVLKLRDSGISYSAVADRLGLERAVDAQAGFVRALRRQPDEERAS